MTPEDSVKDLPANDTQDRDDRPVGDVVAAGRSGGRLHLLGTLAVVGLAATTLTGLATGAFFTDTQSITANAFTTGTVKLGVTPTATAAVATGNMAPGDSIYGQVGVTNTGTLSERYAVLSTTDATDANFLASQLQMTVKSGVTTCSAAGFGATGTVVYGPSVFGSTTGTKVIGDAATGTQPGDRTLAAGATENLCFQVSLPSAAGNPYQAKTTTAVFRFDSEQTANNP